MNRFVFAATELAPALPGGAGTLVRDLAERLAAGGHTVTVVVAADVPVAAPAGAEVVSAPASGGFLDRSRSVAEAVGRVVSGGGADLVEFQDFDGLAIWALTHRAELGLESTPVAIRLHGPVDLMVDAVGIVPPDLAPVRVMEREAFSLADLVIVPSPAVATLAAERYGLDRSRVLVGEPPIADLPNVTWSPAPEPEFVAYGRLAEVKGSHDFVAAAVQLATRRHDVTFRLVGRDGWSMTAGTTMSAWLREQIPARLRNRITVEGEIPRGAAGAALASAWAVVFPSRFESFSLAAHEVRGTGLPIVVPDLPAFRDYFSPATGAVVYDGSVAGLAAALDRLADDAPGRDRLAAAPAPAYGDPLAPYRSPPPRPRHPREQAGLATAAFKRVEVAMPTAEAASRVTARLARTILRRLPEPVAALAIRLVPGRMKDRFREVASWPAEVDRRRRVEEKASLRARIAAGAFPELDEPAVTVVVPCFNQGEFLEDALDSVFRQTAESWEIVVVDDGSTEPATLTVLDELDLPRTRLIRQANAGLAAARNAGMATARGRYMVPLDADDELTPGFLAELTAALAAHPEAAYAHCFAELFGDIARVWVTRPFNRYQMLLSNSVVGCVLLRRDAWEAVGGYDETMRAGNEDWELWLRLLTAGWEQVRVPRPLFRYRKHGVSMSVDTEGRFEAGRAEIVARHPDVYAPDALRRRKREHYPLVSVVTRGAAATRLDEQTIDDVEVVTEPGSARGKYLVEWDAVLTADADALDRLAAALEAAPDAVGASAGPGGSVVMWRRWAVLDPGSGHEGAASAATRLDADPDRLTLGPGALPDDEWMVRPGPDWPDLPIQRQPPEEEGRIPDRLGSAPA